MKVIKYNRTFGIGTCINEKKKPCYIYLRNAKKKFDYLVVGEEIKGDVIFCSAGTRVVLNIEPLHDKYYYEDHPEINYYFY